MFLVLQSLGDRKSTTQVGHYFLLVLNLRNQRFEVLDSMRTLEDEALFKCYNTLIGAIKQLWTKHSYEAKKPICNYELVGCSNLVQQVSSFCGLTNVTFLHTVRFVICTEFYIVCFVSAVMIVVSICWCMLNIGMDVQCNISRRVASLIYASFYCISG